MHEHYYKGFQQKSEFEPVEFGKTASDTLYRRVEYTVSVCGCGASLKKKVEQE